MSNGACCLSSRALQALRFRLLEAAGVSLEPIEFLLPVVLRDCVVLINRTNTMPLESSQPELMRTMRVCK